MRYGYWELGEPPYYDRERTCCFCVSQVPQSWSKKNTCGAEDQDEDESEDMEGCII